MKKKEIKTDWAYVRAAIASGQPPVYDPEVDPYHPNDDAAVKAFWSTAKRVGRPRVTEKRPSLNMRIDADILEHLRGLGKGWQTRLNALLREDIASGKL